MTRPVFILGTGRSGTFQLFKLLQGINGIEAHHEYLFENILQPSVLYRMGLIDKTEIKQILTKTHKAAVFHSNAFFWLDSSNALPWVISPLYELFPDAFFIHLLRDGRKVVSSFYNKFNNVMYDDQSVAALTAWVENPEEIIQPPPEKKYWRPVPVKNELFYNQFMNFDQFQRICYYWQDCNLHIKQSLSQIPSNQKLTFKLEELSTSPSLIKEFLSIFNVQYDESFLQLMQKPVNVGTPKNYPLSDIQKFQFNAIAGTAMTEFNYVTPHEYNVSY